MLDSSSTLSSDNGRSTLDGRKLFRRLSLCICPILSFGLVFAFLLLRSGEIVPTGWVAWAQSKSIQSIYLTKLSDHNFHLKLAGAKAERPEVLVLGSSRSNQWRSAMFLPYSFYNSGNAIFGLSDFTLFLERMGPPFPKVIIFSLDFFTFNNNWAARFSNILHEDIKYEELPLISKKFFKEAWASPRSILKSPIDPASGVPAIGLFAGNHGIGFRIDGSYQYGWLLNGSIHRATATDAIERIRIGEEPFQFANGLDESQVNDFRTFTAFCRRNGISLVGVTMPYLGEVVDVVEQSDRHGIWRQFQGPAFRKVLSEEGVIYFDFGRADTFGGNEEEFVDAFHPSEPAYVRMLLHMLKDKEFRALLPKLSETRLEQKLRNANRFEVFRDEF